MIGPCMEPFLVSPETEEVGLSLGALDLKGVIDWETPEARVNCSRSSTLVRPLAGWGGLGQDSVGAQLAKGETRQDTGGRQLLLSIAILVLPCVAVKVLKRKLRWVLNEKDK